MPQRISILGRRFDRLVVVSETDAFGELLGTPQNRQVEVLCDCGGRNITSARAIRRGRVTSCGCRQRESATTHGMSKHPLYRILQAMKGRCHGNAAIRNPNYGGRGISICDQWMADPVAFIVWGEANGYRAGLEIDRIDNDGNYDPGNCRFVTRTANARNMTTNRIVAYRGRDVTIAELAQESGVAYDTLRQRIVKLGWTPERAAA